MSDAVPSVGPGKIEFIEFHRPGLEDGDYTILVTQQVKTQDGQKVPPTTFFSTKSFTVAGERFDLKPSDIHAVFPPEGSLGEHSNVMPHIILNRSTLPWERDAEEAGQQIEEEQRTPWLALLLFDDAEKPAPRTLTLKQLIDESKTAAAGGGRFPEIARESSQHDDDPLTIIDVPRSLLELTMPAWDELKLLTHVRVGKDSDDDPKDDPAGEGFAVIICNRLPRKGATSTMHLVSVEGRYKKGGKDYEFDFKDAKPADLIRLVSLKSWSFACEDKPSFKGLLENLNKRSSDSPRDPGAFRLPANGSKDDSPAGKFLTQGYVLLPHYFRQGDRTASWYRGPLIPGTDTAEISLPVRTADELLRYDPAIGMFDVSYAAAWELGRLLSLRDKGFSTGLFRWKRSHAQQMAQVEQRVLHPHLSNYGKSIEAGTMPKELSSWFEGLSILRGVPFDYLVPDERMLPPESIRFFQVDGLWMECLLDGAFSIGRVTDSDHKRDQDHTKAGGSASPFETVSGILLRSEVVRGWPGLLVDAYSDADASQTLAPLRMERLSPNVLICLFEGDMKSVAIHQKPETLHFGLDTTDERYSAFHKKLRDKNGNEREHIVLYPLTFSQEMKNVLNVREMNEAIHLLFQRDALKKPDALSNKIKEAKDPVSQFLRDKLAQSKPSAQGLSKGSAPAFDELDRLIEVLNKLLQGPSLHDQNAFANVGLSEAIRGLIALRLQGAKLIALNRMLLEAVYPDEIAKSSTPALTSAHFALQMIEGVEEVVFVAGT